MTGGRELTVVEAVALPVLAAPTPPPELVWIATPTPTNSCENMYGRS